MGTIFSTTLVDTADHHAMLRDSVGKLVGGFGRKYFQDVTKRNGKPEELWNALGEAGFLGVHVDEKYGGGGGGMADYNVIVEETAAQGCPILSLVIGSICAPIIQGHASDAMKDEWLPGLASGKKRLAFAITEPNAGSNTHKVSTIARRDGDGWTLNGQKYWTSAVDEVDAIMVVARGEKLDEKGRGKLSLFLVPVDAEGIRKTPIETALQVPETQFMLWFDDVKLPADALVGEEGKGLKHLFAGLNPERICASAINNGIARYAIEKGAAYAGDRSVWDVPIGAHQGVAHPLAEAYVGVQQARLMTARAAVLYDEGSPEAGEASNMAKFAAADSSLKALDQAIQVHGGNGLALEYGLADLWFIARLHKTAPVSREMVLNFFAQHSLGLPKSY
ncbi:Acyl-CoA dehydrogenase fadE12 [Rhodobacteraceae bacterium THAF1]|uniref:acyl-CoA dehydrogenase family protein n=1 Tax=Palleronia sp. THAF1 TaxID=2587842 RepID=UPI000F3FD7E1|nr:acyl-CoA dehydrogenase family protein [Palleronia sp. THAF1]QFU08779.1 Acyl-CoA dehydrogenase fadE12 [Palleronia sp. THAF1]VDC31204.1 Acyl-CoA dehydrogenase fadE12 [Rhodobacteraceae bacterium THAF1]